MSTKIIPVAQTITEGCIRTYYDSSCNSLVAEFRICVSPPTRCKHSAKKAQLFIKWSTVLYDVYPGIADTGYSLS